MDKPPHDADAESLDPVGWTAVAALWSRAVEQRHENPLLHDPDAAAWLDALGLDTSRLDRSTATRVAVCARARFIDTWVREWATRHPLGVVVELGVGFSTRASRLVKTNLEFIGIDQEPVLRRRQSLNTETSESLLALNLEEPNALEALQNSIGSRPMCIIAEGLFMFLDSSSVDRLLTDLATRFAESPLLFDAYAPPARMLQRFHDSLGKLGQPIRSTFTVSPHLNILASHTLRDAPDAFARLPLVYRLPGVHRLHATYRAVLKAPGSAR
ncbi:MAG: class I SAM-dependent methyltransferase [Planctomycetota bacterium]